MKSKNRQGFVIPKHASLPTRRPVRSENKEHEMIRRSLILAGSVAIAAAAARLLTFRLPCAAMAAPPETAGDGMGGMMGGMSEMMQPGNMMGPMRTGMELFRRHAEIRRTVTDLPNGAHAVTESDDPQTATLIQAHVSEMYQRLDQNRPFPYPMSRSVPAMFAQSGNYQRMLKETPKGIAVTETADDRAMVAIIREHAREISGFVRDGMPAMMRGMMR
jgi:hypothetical protein